MTILLHITTIFGRPEVTVTSSLQVESKGCKFSKIVKLIAHVEVVGKKIKMKAGNKNNDDRIALGQTLWRSTLKYLIRCSYNKCELFALISFDA